MNVKRFKELYNRIFVSRMKRISATIEKSLNNGFMFLIQTGKTSRVQASALKIVNSIVK